VRESLARAANLRLGALPPPDSSQAPSAASAGRSRPFPAQSPYRLRRPPRGAPRADPAPSAPSAVGCSSRGGAPPPPQATGGCTPRVGRAVSIDCRELLDTHRVSSSTTCCAGCDSSSTAHVVEECIDLRSPMGKNETLAIYFFMVHSTIEISCKMQLFLCYAVHVCVRFHLV